MKHLTLLVLLTVRLHSQQPGTVTVSTNITATAGTLSCVFNAPAKPIIHVACQVSGVTELTLDTNPAVGATNGHVGSHSNGSNIITWMIQQPTAGNVTWQIAANGVSQSGTF